MFFIPDENSFGQQAMTDAHTGGWHHLVGKRGMGGAECSLGGNCAGLPGPRWVRAGAWWADGRGTINQVQFGYSLETIGGVLAKLIKATTMRISLTNDTASYLCSILHNMLLTFYKMREPVNPRLEIQNPLTPG